MTSRSRMRSALCDKMSEEIAILREHHAVNYLRWMAEDLRALAIEAEEAASQVSAAAPEIPHS
jgi:hypothetical protein